VTFLERAPNFSVRECKRIETKLAITGRGAIVRQPIGHQCVGVCFSTGLPCSCIRSWPCVYWVL